MLNFTEKEITKFKDKDIEKSEKKGRWSGREKERENVKLTKKGI